MTGPLRLNPPPNLGLGNPLQPNEADGIGIWLTALRMIRRRLPLMLGIVLATCLVALPSIMAIPKKYYAEIRVLIATSPAMRLVSDESQPNITPALDTEIERALSDQLVRQVIADLRIAELEEFTPRSEKPSVFQRLKNMLPQPATPVTPSVSPEDAVMQRFRAALSLGRPNGGNVVTVGFTSLDPRLAETVPTAIVETYLGQSRERWKNEVGRVTQWLGSSIESDRARLSESRAALDRFLAQSGLRADGGVTETSQRLSVIELRQMDLRRERLQTQSDLQSLAAAREDLDLPIHAESAALQSLRQELARERRELTKASTTYGSASPQVKQRADRVAAVEELITSELLAWQHVLEQRAAAEEAEAHDLEAEVSAIRTRQSASRAAQPVANALKETVADQEEAISRLEQRRQNLLARTNVPPVDLEILAPSSVLPYPVGPGRKVYLLATALAAALLALIVAALVELRDGSVRSHEQLTHVMRLVPIGLWPRLKAAQRKAMPDLIAGHAPTPVNDAVRDAIMMLECANRDRFPSMLTVTVADPQDGVEPVAEWLALELAAQGRSVRLVDARGDLAQLAAPPQRQIARQTSRSRDLATILAPAGRVTPERLNLAQMARSRGCDALSVLRDLAEEGQRADCITIIDAPPLMQGSGLRLAREGGHVLLVLRWGQTRRAVVELLAALLGRIGIVQIHTLIIDINPRRHRKYGFDDRLSLSPRGSKGAVG